MTMLADPHYELLRLRADCASLRLDWALFKLGLALKTYNPDQPRVPAGSAEGGRWTSGAGGVSEAEATDASAPSDDGSIQLASDIPQNDTPEIPEERPPTSSERTGIMKWLSNNPTILDLIVQPPLWLQKALPYIQVNMDSPKTLQELQEAVSSPQRGYEIHHIVEQASAAEDGFPRSQIDAPENLVRIPTLRHRDINAWFQTRSDMFNGMSPREYLRGRSWDERVQIGLFALQDAGVLQP